MSSEQNSIKYDKNTKKNIIYELSFEYLYHILTKIENPLDTVVILFAFIQIELIYPQPGWVELDQDVLWQQTQDVIKGALAGENL